MQRQTSKNDTRFLSRVTFQNFRDSVQTREKCENLHPAKLAGYTVFVRQNHQPNIQYQWLQTDHSLRATAVTRHQSGVDEQLIMERTRHRSLESVCSYKRTSDTQFQALSDILIYELTPAMRPAVFPLFLLLQVPRDPSTIPLMPATPSLKYFQHAH